MGRRLTLFELRGEQQLTDMSCRESREMMGFRELLS